MKANAKALFDMFSQYLGNVNMCIGLDENKMVAIEDGSFQNCLQFAAANWSLLVNGCRQVSSAPFKSGTKRFHKMDVEVKSCSCIKLTILHEVKQNGSNGQFVGTIREKGVSEKQGKPVSLECLVGFIDQLPQTLRSLDKGVPENYSGFGHTPLQTHSSSWFSFMKAFTNISDWPKVDVNGFLRDLRFAKVGGVPSGVIGPSSSIKEDGDGSATVENKEDTVESFPQRVAPDKLSIPLPNDEHTESRLSAVSLRELIGLLFQPWLASKPYHDKKKLISEQDFLAYTEEIEGKRFFEEPDRDDGPSVIAQVMAINGAMDIKNRGKEQNQELLIQDPRPTSRSAPQHQYRAPAHDAVLEFVAETPPRPSLNIGPRRDIAVFMQKS